jgi:hypothetical protein
MRRTCRIAVVIVLALALAASAQAQTVIVTPIGPVQPAPRPQPVPADLQIASLVITSPATLRCGTQVISFTAVETNAGAGPAGAHHVDLLKSTGAGFFPVCRIAVGSLAAGVTRTLALSCTFWNGPCDCLPTSYTSFFQLFTDSLNAVTETNEGNNLSNIVALPSTCP